MFLCIFASGSTFAAKKTPQKLYEIEVILFANKTTDDNESEIWQEKPGSPKTQNNISLYSTSEFLLEDYPENVSKYFLQPETALGKKNTLNKYARKIQTSPNYQLLLHYSWHQPPQKKAVFLTDRPDTAPIIFEQNALEPEEISELEKIIAEKTPEELLLEALLEEEKDFSQPLSQLPFFISELDEITTFEDMRGAPVSHNTALSYEGPPEHKAYGNVTLSKGRFLHISLDFLYRGEPYSPPQEEESLPIDEELTEAEIPIDDMLLDEIEETGLSAITIKDKPPLPGFRIKGSKRVRLNQVYYFDHR